MRDLPIDQVSKSQRRTVQMPIQPDTNIMQADLGSQPSLKSGKRVRAFSRQAKGVEQLVEHRLDALTQVSQPPSPCFRPALLAPLVRRRNHLGSQALSPTTMRFVTSKPFVSDVAALCRLARAGQLHHGVSSDRQEGFQQLVIMGTCRAKPVAGDHALWSSRNQQVEPFIPPQPV